MGEKKFYQPFKIYIKKFENFWKITTDQGDDYTSIMKAVDLSKQQALDADAKAIQ